MSKIYFPTKCVVSTAVHPSVLETYFKKDRTTVPSNDISWNNKKLMNLAESIENNSATTKGYVDTELNSAKDHSNIVSIKSGNLHYFGISIIADQALTVYDNVTNVVTQIEDAARLSSYVCTLNKVKLLKDTTINRLYYNTLVDSCFSNTVMASEIINNNEMSIIMIIKNPNLSLEQGIPEYLSWTRDTTLEILITIVNTTVSGVTTTTFRINYGDNSISYVIPNEYI